MTRAYEEDVVGHCVPSTYTIPVKSRACGLRSMESELCNANPPLVGPCRAFRPMRLLSKTVKAHP